MVSRDGGAALRDVSNAPRPGECRIRVRLAGICGTDLQLLKGYAGFSGILGHEFVGLVQEADDPRWVGKRVVGEINVGCGTCAWCHAGIKEHCPERTVLGIKDRGGAFADYLSLPPANLHEVPDRLDDATAVFVEPTAAACQILMQIDVRSDARVAVVGDGRLGLVIAQVLRTTGAPVMLFGKHAHKIEVARKLDLPATLSKEIPAPRDRFDLVVEVTGRAEGLSRALELVRPRGIIVLKSTFHGAASVTMWPAIVDEVRLVGSRCGPFGPAIDLLARGEIRVEPLVSRVCALADFDQAFAAAQHELKVLIRP